MVSQLKKKTRSSKIQKKTNKTITYADYVDDLGLRGNMPA